MQSSTDDVAIALLAFVVGAVRVGIALGTGERWGAGATIGLAFLVGGLVAALGLRRLRLPRAKVRSAWAKRRHTSRRSPESPPSRRSGSPPSST